MEMAGTGAAARHGDARRIVEVRGAHLFGPSGKQRHFGRLKLHHGSRAFSDCTSPLPALS